MLQHSPCRCPLRSRGFVLTAFLWCLSTRLQPTTAFTCPNYTDSFTNGFTVDAIPDAIKPYAAKVLGSNKVGQTGSISQSHRALAIVETFRKKNDNAYYAALIRNSLMFIDEQNKDADALHGVCSVTSSDTAAPQGQCETKENCKWHAAKTGTARKEKYTTAEADAAQTFMTKYAKTLGYVLAPGIVIGVLFFLAIVITMMARCCCKACGVRPKEDGYTALERWIPLLFYVAFVVGVLVSAVFAFAGNLDVSVGMAETFNALHHGVLRLQAFLGRLQSPLVSVEGVVSKSVDQVTHTLHGVTWLSSGLATVTTRLKAFRGLYASTTGFSFVGTSINATLSMVNTQVTPIVDNAQDVIDTLTTQLVPVKSTVQSVVSSAVDILSSANSSVADVGHQLNSMYTQQESMQIFQLSGVMALFIVSIALIFFGCCGVGAGLTPCKCDDWLICFMHFTWVLGSVVVTLSFIIASVALFLGVFWYDICRVVEVAVEDPHTYIKNVQAADAIKSCFTGASLLTALNLSSSLSFTDSLGTQFSSMGGFNVSKAFSLVESPLATTDYQLRAFNGTKYIVEFNKLTSGYGTGCGYVDTYTWGSIATPWAEYHANANNPAGGASYTRQGSEAPWTYIRRVYSAAACSTINTPLFTAWETAYNYVDRAADRNAPEPRVQHVALYHLHLSRHRIRISHVHLRPAKGLQDQHHQRQHQADQPHTIVRGPAGGQRGVIQVQRRVQLRKNDVRRPQGCHVWDAARGVPADRAVPLHSGAVHVLPRGAHPAPTDQAYWRSPARVRGRGRRMVIAREATSRIDTHLYCTHAYAGEWGAGRRDTVRAHVCELVCVIDTGGWERIGRDTLCCVGEQLVYQRTDVRRQKLTYRGLRSLCGLWVGGCRGGAVWDGGVGLSHRDITWMYMGAAEAEGMHVIKPMWQDEGVQRTRRRCSVCVARAVSTTK